MALLKLKKVARKAEEAAYAYFIGVDNIREEVRIPLATYLNSLSSPEVHALRPDKTLIGGYTRYDYETPSGLLGDGEYGDDGVDELGNPLYKVILGGQYITIKKEKVVADKIDLDDVEVKEKFSKKGVDTAVIL